MRKIQEDILFSFDNLEAATPRSLASLYKTSVGHVSGTSNKTSTKVKSWHSHISIKIRRPLYFLPTQLSGCHMHGLIKCDISLSLSYSIKNLYFPIFYHKKSQ